MNAQVVPRRFREVDIVEVCGFLDATISVMLESL